MSFAGWCNKNVLDNASDERPVSAQELQIIAHRDEVTRSKLQTIYLTDLLQPTKAKVVKTNQRGISQLFQSITEVTTDQRFGHS